MPFSMLKFTFCSCAQQESRGAKLGMQSSIFSNSRDSQIESVGKISNGAWSDAQNKFRGRLIKPQHRASMRASSADRRPDVQEPSYADSAYKC